jgi:hypothetical protein
MYKCKMARKVFVTGSYLLHIPGSNTVYSLKDALQQFDGSPLEIRLGDGIHDTGFLLENPDYDEDDDKNDVPGIVGGGTFKGLQLDGNNRWNGLRIVTPEVEVTYTPYGYSVVGLDALQTIEPYAFSGCSSLASVDLSATNVHTIRFRAFYHCWSLASIVFPDALQTIRNSAFWGCNSLVRVVFPDALQTIEEYAFQGCIGLTSVVFPDALQNIREFSFYGCSSLKTVFFPHALQTIGNSAFCGCVSLLWVDFPDTLHTIRNNAFLSCTSLVSVVFPDALETIGTWAFIGCSSLASASVSFTTTMQTPSFPDTCVVTVRAYEPVISDQDGEPLISDQDGNCVICFNPLRNNNGNGYLVKLACGHIFHRACILKWQAENEFRTYVNYISFPICPLCRKPSTQLGSDGVYRLINLRF